MKILILSNNPLSQTANNGKTIRSIIKALGDHEFAQIFFSSGSAEGLAGDSQYSVTDEELVGLFFKRLNLRSALNEKKTETSSELKNDRSFMDGASPFKSELYRLIREVLWKLPLGHKKRLMGFAESFKPDLLFITAGDFIFANKLALDVQLKTNCRLVTYCTDDYVLTKHGFNILGHVRSFFILAGLKQLIRRSSSYLTISESMKIAYEQVFDKGSTLAYNTVELRREPENFPRFFPCDERITFVYAGGLHLDRISSIAILAEHLEMLTESVVIKIYSHDSDKLEIRNKMRGYKTVELMLPVEADALGPILDNADILLHVESFDPYFSSRTHFSLSTKIPEYLSYGKPLLAIGPQNLASMKHVRDCCVCITHPESDMAKVTQLINSKAYREDVGARCLKKFNTDHDPALLKADLKKAFGCE